MCGQETVRTFFAEARMAGVKYRKIRYPCIILALPLRYLSTAYHQRIHSEMIGIFIALVYAHKNPRRCCVWRACH